MHHPTGHFHLMIFQFPLLNSVRFEYDFLFRVFNDVFFIPHRAFQLGWLGSFKCLIVLTAFLVEICVMLGQELIIACIVQ